jgi:hypothetical protein
LLRSELHNLFDQGYLTVTLDFKVEMSRRIREEFDSFDGLGPGPFTASSRCPQERFPNLNMDDSPAPNPRRLSARYRYSRLRGKQV